MSLFCESIADALKKKIKPGNAIGITTFISKTLRGNAGAYCRPTGRKKPLSSTKGIQKGRRLDLHFQHYIKTKRAHPSLANVKKVLQNLGVKMIATQVTVVDPDVNKPHGLKTQLDGVGVIPNTRTIVVVELKSTQFTLKEHKQLYKTPCKKLGLMKNTLPNSEHTSHCLQTAFGVKAFEKCFKLPFLTQGIIIVNCSDNKAAYYVVSKSYGNPTNFCRHLTSTTCLPRKITSRKPLHINLKCNVLTTALKHLFSTSTLQISKDGLVGKCISRGKKIAVVVAKSCAHADVLAAKTRLFRINAKSTRKGVLLPQKGTYVFKAC